MAILESSVSYVRFNPASNLASFRFFLNPLQALYSTATTTSAYLLRSPLFPLSPLERAAWPPRRLAGPLAKPDLTRALSLTLLRADPSASRPHASAASPRLTTRLLGALRRLSPSASHELADPPRSPPRSPLWSRTSPSLSHLSFPLGSDLSRLDSTRYAIGCTTPTSRLDPSQSRLIRARSTLLHADSTPSDTGSNSAATFLASSPFSCTQFAVRSTPISRSRTFLLFDPSDPVAQSTNPSDPVDSLLHSSNPPIASPHSSDPPDTSPPSSKPIAPIPDLSDASIPAPLLFLTPPNPTDVPTQQTSLETHF